MECYMSNSYLKPLRFKTILDFEIFAYINELS